MNNSIQTHTGKFIDVFNPKPEQIDIEDIAHGLAHTCRFAGMTKRFYSVGTHSVMVARMLYSNHDDALVAMYGLLHDASEAYIGDMPRPIKVAMPEYQQLEKTLQNAIYSALGLDAMPPEIYKLVKEVDNQMLLTEKRQLLEVQSDRWDETGLGRPYFGFLPDWEYNAKSNFLMTYDKLKGKL